MRKRANCFSPPRNQHALLPAPRGTSGSFRQGKAAARVDLRGGSMAKLTLFLAAAPRTSKLTSRCARMFLEEPTPSARHHTRDTSPADHSLRALRRFLAAPATSGGDGTVSIVVSEGFQAAFVVRFIQDVLGDNSQMDEVCQIDLDAPTGGEASSRPRNAFATCPPPTTGRSMPIVRRWIPQTCQEGRCSAEDQVIGGRTCRKHSDRW